MQIHPNDVLLREFVVSVDCCQEIKKHLDKCPRCREKLRTLGKTTGRSEPTDYSAAIDRSLAALQKRQDEYDKEQEKAPELLNRLLSLPTGRQALLLRNSRQFQTWGLFDLLLQHSQQQSFVDPIRSENLASLALNLSDHLDSGFYGGERLEDLRARAWGYIGNARRLKVDLAGAEEAFSRAFLSLRQGTGESMERAALFSLKASFRRFQGRFDECLRLLQRAASVFWELGQSHYVGKTLVQMSNAQHFMGCPHEALPLLDKALSLIDRSQDIRLQLCTWHNLADGLATVGQFLEARGVLTKARSLYEKFPDRVTQSRRLWVEAKVAEGLGRFHEAEAHLLKARDGFMAADLPQDLVLLSRDLLSIRRRLTAPVDLAPH